MFSLCFYPHMPIGKAWIYRLLFFVCVCVFVFIRLRISPPRIKLAASNFAWRFNGVEGRKSHILGNFAPSEAKNRTNRPARGPRAGPLITRSYCSTDAVSIEPTSAIMGDTCRQFLMLSFYVQYLRFTVVCRFNLQRKISC